MEGITQQQAAPTGARKAAAQRGDATSATPTVARGIIVKTLSDGALAFRATAYIPGLKRQYAQHSTLKEAKAWQRDTEAEMAKAAKEGRLHLGAGKVPDIKMSEVFRLYKDDALTHGLKLSKRVLSTVARLSKHSVLADVKVIDIREAMMKFCIHRKMRESAVASTVYADFVRVHQAVKCCNEWYNWGGFDPFPAEVWKNFMVKGLIAKSSERKRRLQTGELEALLAIFSETEAKQRAGGPRQRGNAHGVWDEQVYPMCDIVNFALASAFRVGEICRLRWADIDGTTISCWRKDSENANKGNDETRGRRHCIVPLPQEALEIILRQPRTPGEDRIFPYVQKNVGDKFTAACKRVRREARAKLISQGVKTVKESTLPCFDLCFHDLRHEAISWLSKFMSPTDLKEISGHKTLASLIRYIHGVKEHAEVISAKVPRRTPVAANDERSAKLAAVA